MSESSTNKDDLKYHQHDIGEDEIDLVELFQTIKKGWKTLVVVVLITFFSTLYYLASAPNIFRADAHIMPLGGRSNIEMDILEFSNMELFKDIIKASMPTGFSSPTTSRIRSTILSKNFLIYFIEKYKLLPLLYPDAYDTVNKKWNVEKSCKEVEQNSIEKITGIHVFSQECHPTIMHGYKKLSTMIQIDKSDYFTNDSNLIQISVESPEALFSQMILVKLLNEADHELRQTAIKMATENQEYFASILSQTNDEKIKSRLQTVINSQLEQAMYAQTKAQFLFEIVDPPMIPDEPIKPKRPLVLVVSLVTAFILGIFMIFFLQFIRKN